MLRQVVTDALVDTDDEHADQWLDLPEGEADALVGNSRGVAGVHSFRERMLSGSHGLAGAVQVALSTKGMTA